MILPKPSDGYDANNEAQARAALALADGANQKKSADVVISKNRLILTAPNGAQWSVVVSNTGTLSAVAI